MQKLFFTIFITMAITSQCWAQAVTGPAFSNMTCSSGSACSGPKIDAGKQGSNQISIGANGGVTVTLSKSGNKPSLAFGISTSASLRVGDALLSSKGVAVTGKPLPSSFFGIHYKKAVAGDSPQTPYQPLGFGSLRLWDCYTNWTNLETSKGVWDWTRLDAMVALGYNHGLEIVMTLGQPPAWATGGVRTGPFGGNYNSSPPTSNQDWIDYLTAVGNRYKGKIKYYEVWNEPDISAFWSGTTARLVELTQIARSTLKAIDPNIQIISPCPTSLSGVSYLNTFLTAGGGAYVDIIGAHLYVSPQQPEAMIDLAQKYRAVMYDNGVGTLPLWNTESTWLSYMSNGVLVDGAVTGMSDKQGSAYAMRMFAACWVGGVERCFLYGMDHPWGIRPVNTSTPSVVTATGNAIKNFATWAVGKRLADYSHDPVTGVYQIAAYDAQGKISRYVWTDDTTPGAITLEAATGAGIATLWDESKVSLAGGTLPVDMAPQLIIGTNDFISKFQAVAPQIPFVTKDKPFDKVTTWTTAGGLLLSEAPTETFSPELNNDSHFASSSKWAPVSGWTISGGVATAGSVTEALWGAYATIPQSIPGRTYDITFTISSISAGGFMVAMNGHEHNQFGTNIRTTPGTYTERVTALYSNSFAIQPSGTTSGVISYFSVKEVVTVPGSAVHDPRLYFDTATGILHTPRVTGTVAVLAQSAVPVALTGTTAETTLATVIIPGGTLGTNGAIRITHLTSHTNSANNKVIHVKFGGTTFQSFTDTTSVWSNSQTVIRNRGAVNSQIGGINFNAGNVYITTTSGNAPITASINTAVDQPLIITGTLANSGENITLEGYTVELLPGS